MAIAPNPYLTILPGALGGTASMAVGRPVSETDVGNPAAAADLNAISDFDVREPIPSAGMAGPLNVSIGVRIHGPAIAPECIPESGIVRRWCLADLFPESAQKLCLAEMGAYLSANSETRRSSAPPTLSRLKKVQERLEQRSFDNPAAILSQQAYLEKVKALMAVPTGEEIFAAAQRLAPFSTRATEAFWTLSPLGQMGVYDVAAALPVRDKDNVGKVLTSRAIASFRSFSLCDVFETAALLADRRVKGFEQAFQSRQYRGGRVVDDKFLSTPEQGQHHKRLPGEFAEYQESLRMVGHSAVAEVIHDARLPVDWSRLTVPEEDYVRKYIERHIPFNFRSQREADVDAVFRLRDGRRRLLEVKSSCGYLDLHDDYVHKELLQIFRHALLTRIHGLEGVDYVFRSPRISRRLPRRFAEVLDLAGVNYVLTWRRSGDAPPEVLAQRGMKPLGGDMPLPTERIYPFVL